MTKKGKQDREKTSNPKKGKDATGKEVAESQGHVSKGKKKKQNARDDTVADEAVVAGGGGGGEKLVVEGSVKGGKKNKEKDAASKNSKKKNTKKCSKKKNETLKTEDQTAETDTGSHRQKKEHGRIRNVPTSKAQIENYQQFMIDACNVGVGGIIKQFNDYLKAFVPPGATVKAFEKNIDKNRYKDVVCLDHSRIVLKGKPAENDYIHANMVEGEPLCNKFIACQGPLHNTTYDFWRMVVQEKSQNIFMLCQTVEMDKEKCHQYWPKDKGCAMSFKEITIRNVDVDKTTDNTSVISTLHVSVGAKDLMILKHYHWQNWPDKSIPQSILAPFRLLRTARTCKSPTIVHCSAGVGRTGVIIGLEMALQQILTGKPVNIPQIIQELRMKRMHCVQTDLQLVYIFRCLFAYAEVSGVLKSNVDLDNKTKIFVRDYDALIIERLNLFSKSPSKIPVQQPHQQQQQLPCLSKEQITPATSPSPGTSPTPQSQSPMTPSPPKKNGSAEQLPPKSDYF